MNKRFFRFNTGRVYSPYYHSQRICCLAEEVDDRIVIYFNDFTRGVTGMVQWRTDRGLDLFADWALENNVMSHYDRCDYSHPPELQEKLVEIDQYYKTR